MISNTDCTSHHDHIGDHSFLRILMCFKHYTYSHTMWITGKLCKLCIQQDRLQQTIDSFTSMA